MLIWILTGVLGEEALGSCKILRGVHRYAVVQDRDHLQGVAVFDEAQLLRSLGALPGPTRDVARGSPRQPEGSASAGPTTGALWRARVAWERPRLRSSSPPVSSG